MAHISGSHKCNTLIFEKRDKTNFIVVHCSDTPEKLDVGVNDIRKWHKDRGWKDIGYHYVIRRNGLIEAGRNYDVVGAHVSGFNKNSIGICLVGREKNYSEEQWKSLARALKSLTQYYKGAIALGHCDLDPVKKRNCPGFDVKSWWARQATSALDSRDFSNAS